MERPQPDPTTRQHARRALNKNRADTARSVTAVSAIGLIIGTILPWAMLRLTVEEGYDLAGAGGIGIYQFVMWPGKMFIWLGILIFGGALLNDPSDIAVLHLSFGIRAVLALIASILSTTLLVLIGTAPTEWVRISGLGIGAITVTPWLGVLVLVASAISCLVNTTIRWIATAGIAHRSSI